MLLQFCLLQVLPWQGRGHLPVEKSLNRHNSFKLGASHCWRDILRKLFHQLQVCPISGPMSLSGISRFRHPPNALCGGQFRGAQIWNLHKIAEIQTKSSKKSIQKIVTHFSKFRPSNFSGKKSPTFWAPRAFLTDTRTQICQHTHTHTPQNCRTSLSEDAIFLVWVDWLVSRWCSLCCFMWRLWRTAKTSVPNLWCLSTGTTQGTTHCFYPQRTNQK